MTTSSRFSGSSAVVSGVAVTRPSPRCVGSGAGSVVPLILPMARGHAWMEASGFGPCSPERFGSCSSERFGPCSLQHLEGGQRTAEGRVDPAAVAGPADQLGLDV